MVEYAFLSGAVYWAYAAEIKPSLRSRKSIGAPDAEGRDRNSSASASEHRDNGIEPPVDADADADEQNRKSDITWSEYVYAVFKFQDVFYNITPFDNSLTTPLTASHDRFDSISR